MKIYLASRYSRRYELIGVRAVLEKLGHSVTSRWLNGDHQISDTGLGPTSRLGDDAERIRFACEDWEDVLAADWVISFTEEPRAINSRGGRHVEFGAAMALNKRCIIVGPRENVFHCLPAVEWAPNWMEFLTLIGVKD